jgi:cellulose synthase operon protein YhjQ
MGHATALDWKQVVQEAETRATESAKSNGDEGVQGGPVRYDAVQGIWVRAEKVSDLPPSPGIQPDSDPAAAPAAIGVDESQQKATRESGSLFKWSSWFRTEAEKHQDLVTPVLAEASERGVEQQALDQDTTIVPASTTVQDLDEPGPQALAIDDNTSVSAPLSASDWSQGGTMWRTETTVDEPIPNVVHLAGEIPPGMHDQDLSRWFALKGVLGDGPAPQETPVTPAAKIPVLEVFSFAGGVGKTSLVASLGRALSARGEHVLLVEATPLGSLPYFFGSCERRPGAVRTFRPPAGSSDVPIRLANVDPDVPVENAAHGSLVAEIEECARGTSRVVVDVATGSVAMVRALGRMSPTVLVPLVPDLNAILTARSIDSFFQQQAATQDVPSDVYYVLNQFDQSLPLHLEVRKVLREKLGEHLLPFELQRIPAVSEAVAEGMTIMDYAPDSPIAGEFVTLANWLESVAAPVDLRARSRRWSEQ